MIKSSIVPPKERLVVGYRKHANEYIWLQHKFHLDAQASEKDSQEFGWHKEEMIKLEKVLNALYPGWDEKETD